MTEINQQKQMETESKETLINDDGHGLIWNGHKSIQIIDHDPIQYDAYDLLICGYATRHQCDYELPFHIVQIAKCYLPVDFKSIDCQNESNLYIKKYEAKNIFGDTVGPIITDYNQRIRKIVIAKLYTFTKNNYNDFDNGSSKDITNYTIHSISTHINTLILDTTIYKMGDEIARKSISIQCDNCYDDIFSDIAQQYGISIMDLKQQFKNINIDLLQWFQ